MHAQRIWSAPAKDGSVWSVTSCFQVRFAYLEIAFDEAHPALIVTKNNETSSTAAACHLELLEELGRVGSTRLAHLLFLWAGEEMDQRCT